MGRCSLAPLSTFWSLAHSHAAFAPHRFLPSEVADTKMDASSEIFLPSIVSIVVYFSFLPPTNMGQACNSKMSRSFVYSFYSSLVRKVILKNIINTNVNINNFVVLPIGCTSFDLPVLDQVSTNTM